MGKKKKVEPFYDLPIQHCLQPATTSTSPGCKGFEGCSCNCDPCNGRRWEAVRPDPDLSVLPVPADVVPPVQAWGSQLAKAVELATRDDARPEWHVHWDAAVTPEECAWCLEGVELRPKAPAWAASLIEKLEEEIDELEERLKAETDELQDRIDALESSLERQIENVEKSLERRIGNVEDDVHSMRSDVDALERGSR
jgi:hypothetical protein